MKPRDRMRAQKAKRLRQHLRRPPMLYTHYESEQEIDGVLERVWILEVVDPLLGTGWHVAGLLTTEEGKARLVFFGFPPVEIAQFAPITIQAFDGEREQLISQAQVAFDALVGATSPMLAEGKVCRYEAHDVDGDDQRAQLVFAGYPWAHCFGVQTGGHG